MADARLRQAHRLPGATIEAEVAALHARLRAGQLSPTQLRLAAYCGHLAALHVMGDLELLDYDTDVQFVVGLAPFGLACWRRAAHTVLGLLVTQYETRLELAREAPRRQKLEWLIKLHDRERQALAHWIAAPTPRHEAELRAATGAPSDTVGFAAGYTRQLTRAGVPVQARVAWNLIGWALGSQGHE